MKEIAISFAVIGTIVASFLLLVIYICLKGNNAGEIVNSEPRDDANNRDQEIEIPVIILNPGPILNDNNNILGYFRPYNGSELRDNGNNRNQDVAPAVAPVVPGGRSPYDF